MEEDETRKENCGCELARVQELEAENRRMQNEFNMQRAKLKELFMQKETEYSKCLADRQNLQRELDEMKSQFLVADIKSENEMRLSELKAQQEISSLQLLLQETINECTIYKADLEKMKEEINHLGLENRELRVVRQRDSAVSMLTTTETNSNCNCYRESIEDIKRPNSCVQQFAHEDAEVLRSIVIQLQEEMQVLKEKLRDADERLQSSSSCVCFRKNLKAKYRQSESSIQTPSIQTSSIQNQSLENPSLQNPSTTDCECECEYEWECASCSEYESKLKSAQSQLEEEQKKMEVFRKSLEESRDDLEKESALRRDLESQWQEKREAHKLELQFLREQVKNNEQRLLDLQQKFLEAKDDVMSQLRKLTEDRESVNKHLETVQADNDFLSGQYLATAEEIENQCIDLPNTVEELQEFILRQQSDLVQARVSSEHEKQKCLCTRDEVEILREQFNATNNERRSYKKKVQNEMKSLQDRLSDHLMKFQQCETTKVTLERREAELNRCISELRVEIIELQENNEKLIKTINDYKSKIKNLQDDLSTSEQVQKDFVKLSQSLQMSLEKLRCADTEVRWQDDDDVDNCPTCSLLFTVTVRKIHCRHCGHIFCDKCLTKTVPSGPRKRPARVCDICHTLLTPNTAPYFSQESCGSMSQT